MSRAKKTKGAAATGSASGETQAEPVTPTAAAPDEHPKEGAAVVDAAAPVDVRQSFLDAAAIQLFARGYPVARVWAQSETLWASREAYLKAGSK